MAKVLSLGYTSPILTIGSIQIVFSVIWTVEVKITKKLQFWSGNITQFVHFLRPQRFSNSLFDIALFLVRFHNKNITKWVSIVQKFRIFQLVWIIHVKYSITKSIGRYCTNTISISEYWSYNVYEKWFIFLQNTKIQVVIPRN